MAVTVETNDGGALDVTTTDAYDDGTTQTGNSITGDYSSTGGGHTQTSVAQSGQADGDNFSLTSTDDETYGTTASGNTVTGDSSSTQSGTSSYSMTKSDTYSDGNDNETVTRYGTDREYWGQAAVSRSDMIHHSFVIGV